MKKLISLFLTLVLLCAAGIPALAEGWPTAELNGKATELNTLEIQKDFRQQSHSGPGRGYSLSGAYLPHKIVSAKAVYRENGYVMTEVDYRAGLRYVYFREEDLTVTDVEEANWTPVHARTTARIKPFYYGPGRQYDRVTQRKKSPYADLTMEELMFIFDGDEEKIAKALEDIIVTVELTAGSRVDVLFEKDGWVYCEFDCTILGLARAWLPADQVTAE